MRQGQIAVHHQVEVVKFHVFFWVADMTSAFNILGNCVHDIVVYKLCITLTLYLEQKKFFLCVVMGQ